MVDTDMTTLGGRCRVFRHLRGLTLQELADKAETNISTVNRIELGKHPTPMLGTVVALAAALHVDVDVLLGARPFDPKEDTWTTVT